MSVENEVVQKRKTSSKIGALLSNSLEMNNSEVKVYYSQNNWETSEVVEVMIDDKTTVLQLIDSVIYKLKTEFYYDDIDEKNYILMILKKKTKTPNYDYPKCNPESLVKDYQKSNFCLVEAENLNNNIIINKNNNININIDNDKENIKKKNTENKEEEKKEIKIKEDNNKKKDNNKNNNNKSKSIKSGKGCNKGCIIF